MATSPPNEQPVYEEPVFGVGFLLSTLGFRSHAVWAERLSSLGLDARQAAMLLQIARAEGRSQQALARALKIPPSRVVALVDELEHRQLLRRRSDPTDRRVRTLHLTSEGRTMVQRLAEISVEHESWLCVGLEVQECQQLTGLLKKVAAGLELSDTVHAGLAGGEWKPA
jgi:DNA-binding MarR family transcriptional regulator